MKKRILSLIMSLVFCLTLLPAAKANAEGVPVRWLMDAEALPDGNIAVLFLKGIDTAGGELYYGIYNPADNSWDEQPVGKEAPASTDAAMTLVKSTAHIAYVNADGDIAYTSMTKNGWSDVVIITSNDCNEKEGVLTSPDIEVDNKGYVHISYMDSQGAEDDYYHDADLMYATNETGEFEKKVIVSGTGWFSSPDGDRSYASTPVLTLNDNGYNIAYWLYSWSKWMGGSDKSYEAGFASSKGSTAYNENYHSLKVCENCGIGTDTYTLIHIDGKYKIIKTSVEDDKSTASLLEGSEIEFGNIAADLTKDTNNKIYYAAIDDTSLLFYQDGKFVNDIAVKTPVGNYKRIRTAVSGADQFVLYIGSDNLLSIAKVN